MLNAIRARDNVRLFLEQFVDECLFSEEVGFAELCQATELLPCKTDLSGSSPDRSRCTRVRDEFLKFDEGTLEALLQKDFVFDGEWHSEDGTG